MRTRLVSVVGSGSPLAPEVAALAEELGAALVQAGFGVVTGGLGGVMEAVSRGAANARGEKRHPPVIGILPSYDADAGNAYIDIALASGLGHGRNALVASAGDAVICLGGAMGALSEVALARKMGRPVIAFAETGGTAGLAAKAIDSVIPVVSVGDAVAKVKDLVE